MTNYISNGKAIIIHLIAGLIKKIQYDSIDCNCINISQYFPKLCEPFGGDVNVKVDVLNYATKADIKNILHVDTSSFVLKKNLASLKTEVDKLDVDKLVPVHADLGKLSDVVKNDVVIKDVYDKLVAKVNDVDTSRFVLKTKYDTDKLELENKIPNVAHFVKKTNLTKLENKIPDISNLSTKTALTTLENKIPDVTNLATKTALSTLENKIPDLNSLVKKTDYNTTVAEIDTKVSSRDGQIAENKTKKEFIEEELANATLGN